MCSPVMRFGIFDLALERKMKRLENIRFIFVQTFKISTSIYEMEEIHVSFQEFQQGRMMMIFIATFKIQRIRSWHGFAKEKIKIHEIRTNGSLRDGQREIYFYEENKSAGAAILFINQRIAFMLDSSCWLLVYVRFSSTKTETNNEIELC